MRGDRFFQTASAVCFFTSNGNLIKQSNGFEFLYAHTGVFAVKYNSSTYFYRKDAQANIVALLDNNGSVVVKYKYDAWGNGKVLNADCSMISDDTHIGILNPFRYRSYYYNTGIGLYFLKTRYYDPEIGRFMTIDDISYLNPDSINGLNLYAYCRNNPITRCDPVGTFDWGMLWDNLITAFSIVSGIVIGVATGLLVGTYAASRLGPVGGFVAGSIAGGIAGVATTGLINNAVNFVYYTWISDGVSCLNSSSYNIDDSKFRYLTRWDRLDYAKQQVKSMYGENASSFFDLKAWMYYNEYNFHMYAWAVLKRFHGEHNLLGNLAESAKEAAVDPLWEDDLIRYPFYILIGLLGM